jgi:hypothetical protein
MPVGNTAPVTANEISVTQHAQQDFDTAVSQLNTIASTVNDAGVNLTQTGMVTTAGQAFNNAVQMWYEDFLDIKSTLQWMATQLGITAAALQASNQQSAEMAASLPPPGGF